MSKHCLLGAALLLSACQTPPQPELKDGDPVIGHQVATELCSGCHAVEKTGDSPHPAAPPLRRVLENYRPDSLAEDLHNSINIAHMRMPTFYFGAEHEYDLVAYLLTIQEHPKR